MRKRVAIIGGGLSGLTAAYELSRTPELRARFDVTVYQIGWRLGGKLASGRNPERAFRNEEHGLHVWFGFYHNAFRLLAELDTKWKRPDGFPFASLRDGFRPESYTPVGDRVGDAFHPWHLHFPRNAGWPGVEDTGLTGWESLTHTVGWLAAVLRMTADAGRVSSTLLGVKAPWRAGTTNAALSLAANVIDSAAKPIGALFAAGARLHPDTRIALGANLGRALALASRTLVPALDALVHRNPRYTHLLNIVETTLAFLRGVLNPQYEVLRDLDFDRLNHLDFRQFLVDNGARRETVEDWSGIRGVYDAMFQYIDGDPAQPSFEAGTASRVLLRAGLLYRGAALWLPQAGMGELLIAPLYDVLRAQGVRVELFHELTRAESAADEQSIERLHFRVQARTKHGEPYRPTFVHGGMSCWTAAPDWRQLESGDEMCALGVDLDAPGSGFCEDVKVLEAGTDFDDVILALPLGTLAARRGEANPCEEIVARSAKLHELCRRASLAPSLSVQLWTSRCLGAPSGGSRALGTLPAAAFGWAQPLSIWADMRSLLRLENWPITNRPDASYYACGTWAATSNDPAVELLMATKAVREQLDGPACHWPDFTWEALHEDGTTHEDQLDGQLVRVNVRAADLCDGAAVGTSRFRPDVRDTGFTNLVYCGTWTRTGINSSCVEAATMSGLAAARALSGETRVIVGEHFLSKPLRASHRPSNETATVVDAGD